MDGSALDILPLNDIMLPSDEVNRARSALQRSAARPNHFPSHAPFMDISPSLKDWTVQTHFFPAASPRACPESSYSAHEGVTCIYRRLIRSFSPHDANARENAVRTGKQFMELSQGIQRQADRDWISQDKPNLFIAVNRYFRKRAVDTVKEHDHPITLVLAHANGMHKEVKPSFTSSAARSHSLDPDSNIFRLVDLGACHSSAPTVQSPGIQGARDLVHRCCGTRG